MPKEIIMRTKSQGFSLVELLVVIAIFTTLLYVTTIDFNSWQRKYSIEAQVKEMQSDLNNVRIMAIQNKRNYRVVLNPTSYSFRHYSTETTLSTAVDYTKALNYPIQQFSSGSLSAFNNTAIEVDMRGLVTNPAHLMTIAVGVGLADPTFNCLTVHYARGNIGRINGTVCDFK